MQLLIESKWKNKICFDNSLYKEVKSFAQSLKDPLEKKSMLLSIDFYRNNFSFDQILKATSTFTRDTEFMDFLTPLNSRYSNLINCPKELKKYYLNVLSKNELQNKHLLPILNMALNSKRFAPTKKYYKELLGKLYKKSLKMCFKYASRYESIPKEPRLKAVEYKLLINNTKNYVLKNINTHSIWGTFINKDFTVLENHEGGKGKWNSKILGAIENSFTINTNNNNINSRQLITSFYFNVYPGYGNFYENICDNEATKFDSGATFLINGWATFSAWHYQPNAYTKYRKNKLSKIISFMLKYNNQRGVHLLYMYLMNVYGKTMALTFLKYITQYPTYIESYVLGSFVVESLIDTKFCFNPADFLKKLKNLDKGDFFVYYLSLINKNK